MSCHRFNAAALPATACMQLLQDPFYQLVHASRHRNGLYVSCSCQTGHLEELLSDAPES